MSGQILANIGTAYWGLLFLSVLWGWLRNNKILFIHLVFSSLILYFGVKYLPLNLPCQGNSNGAGFLFGPIVFVISYALLRMFYKKAFKREPDMRAYSSYSIRDNRRLNSFDYLTFFIPVMLSAIINLMLANE